jgi:hypothetical protein
MTSKPPLTRAIGQTERTLQALLQRQFAGSGLSFADWTILVFLSGGPLRRSDLLARLAEGHIGEGGSAQTAVDGLIGAGLIDRLDRGQDGCLRLTEAGDGLFQSVRRKVAGVTTRLFETIAGSDIEATRATLDLVARRATDMLAETASSPSTPTRYGA